MSDKRAQISLDIAASTGLLKMVVELTTHVATLAHFSPKESNKISLAIDEAVTNVIKHSYKYDINKKIKINYHLSVQGIEIELLYGGEPFVIKDNKSDLRDMIKNKRKGGLGVRLIKTIMDEVEYKVIKGENLCRLVKLKKQMN